MQNSIETPAPLVNGNNGFDSDLALINKVSKMADPVMTAHYIRTESYRRQGDEIRELQRLLVRATKEKIRTEVARSVFGDKLSGDLGVRSTADHPKTDFGEAWLGSGWDLGEK